MIYFFKLCSHQHKTSKIVFCSGWLSADDSLGVIAQKDKFLATHPEYSGCWVTWENKTTKDKLMATTLTKALHTESDITLEGEIITAKYWNIQVNGTEFLQLDTLHSKLEDHNVEAKFLRRLSTVPNWAMDGNTITILHQSSEVIANWVLTSAEPELFLGDGVRHSYLKYLIG